MTNQRYITKKIGSMVKEGNTGEEVTEETEVVTGEEVVAEGAIMIKVMAKRISIIAESSAEEEAINVGAMHSPVEFSSATKAHKTLKMTSKLLEKTGLISEGEEADSITSSEVEAEVSTEAEEESVVDSVTVDEVAIKLTWKRAKELPDTINIQQRTSSSIPKSKLK